MDNYNFTKGKWKNSDIRVISYNEEKKVSEQVCQCFIMTFKHDSIGKRIEDVEGKANALLISKAPEMLEALKMFVEAVYTEEIIIKENYDNDGHENCGGRLYQKFKQLIKEATEI